MPRIRLTKIFNYEAAHALWGYDGKCKHLHGHSYILHVTVIGEPIEEDNHIKQGMVIDFGDLKKIVKEEIIDKIDHATVLNNKAPYSDLPKIPDMFDKMVLVDYQPTCEKMVGDFADIIKKRLPDGVDLHSLRLYETASSFAEWFAEDN